MSDVYLHPEVPGLETPEGALFYDSLSELEARVNTGDLLLLSGNGSFSGTVRLFANSPYSHVVVVVVYVDKMTGKREVYCYESTQSYDPLDYYWASPICHATRARWELRKRLGMPLPGLGSTPVPLPPLDAGEPRPKTGPKLSRLREKLAYYAGAFVTVRHLHISEPDPFKRDLLARQMKWRLADRFHAICNLPYESDILKLGGSLLGQPFSHTWAGAGGGMFCTEMAIDMLRYACICKPIEGRPAPTYLLNDFLSPCDATSLCTLPPFSYGPEISVRLEQRFEDRRF